MLCPGNASSFGIRRKAAGWRPLNCCGYRMELFKVWHAFRAYTVVWGFALEAIASVQGC